MCRLGAEGSGLMPSVRVPLDAAATDEHELAQERENRHDHAVHRENGSPRKAGHGTSGRGQGRSPYSGIRCARPHFAPLFGSTFTRCWSPRPVPPRRSFPRARTRRLSGPLQPFTQPFRYWESAGFSGCKAGRLAWREALGTGDAVSDRGGLPANDGVPAGSRQRERVGVHLYPAGFPRGNPAPRVR